MTYEDELNASTRALQAVDQQLAACRDANARLTAETVRLEIELRSAKGAIEKQQKLIDVQADAILDLKAEKGELTGQLIAQNVYIDELEHKLDRQGEHNGH